MLRCQTCGSRNAMWEWCSRCGNPNPFAWFKRFRAIAVLLVLGFSVLLALRAHQRTKELDLSAQEFASGTSRGVYLVRHTGS